MKTNRIPFDASLRKEIEAGKYKVETRDGRPARIICWDAHNRFFLIVLVADEYDFENIYKYVENGRFYGQTTDEDTDLFLVPVEQELTEFEKALTGIIEEAIVNKQWHKSIRNDACYLESIARKEIVKEHSTVRKQRTPSPALKKILDSLTEYIQKAQKEMEKEAWRKQQDATAYEMRYRAAMKELDTFKWSRKDQRNLEAVSRAIVSCTSGVEGVDGNETQLIEWLSIPFRRRYYQNSEYPTIRGWVARDYDGRLYWFCHKPERGYVEWFDKYGRTSASQMISLNEDDFPTLRWEDEPMEVELIIKPKE